MTDTMTDTIHTLPAKARNAIRSPNAMCPCGRPAHEHVNHFGPCLASGCARWEWAPDDAGVTTHPAPSSKRANKRHKGCTVRTPEPGEGIK